MDLAHCGAEKKGHNTSWYSKLGTLHAFFMLCPDFVFVLQKMRTEMYSHPPVSGTLKFFTDSHVKYQSFKENQAGPITFSDQISILDTLYASKPMYFGRRSADQWEIVLSHNKQNNGTHHITQTIAALRSNLVQSISISSKSLSSSSLSGSLFLNLFGLRIGFSSGLAHLTWHAPGVAAGSKAILDLQAWLHRQWQQLLPRQSTTLFLHLTGLGFFHLWCAAEG